MDPLPELNDSMTAEELAIRQLSVYPFGFDYLTPAMNTEIEKILDYLKKAKTLSAGDSGKVDNYTNAEKILKSLHTKINQMYHTCGIMDVLLFSGSITLKGIAATEDQELLMIATPLAEIINDQSALINIQKYSKELETFLKGKDETFVTELRKRYSEIYAQKCTNLKSILED